MKTARNVIVRVSAIMLVMGPLSCGESPEVVDAQMQQDQPIINGDPASDQAKTIQGAMLYGSGSSYRVFCGAVYLGTNSQGQAWAATAAHCVDALETDHRFGFGGLDVNGYTTSNTVGWSQEVRHPQWNSSNLVNDAAVVRLAAVPALGSAVTLATPATDASAGESVMISGYGFDTNPSLWCLFLGWFCPPTPMQLLDADTTVLSTSACQQTFNGVNASHICVRDSVGDQGACNGDSGGPMFRSNGTVVGLTSYGVAGCATNNPSVYTRISAFRQWIQDTTGI